ncbi:MAG: hypothetical protein HYX66_06640 [Ignavibacteria bacterium]|nr:hypothetical protein [Ignavibacteria bacterium]
MPLTRLSLAILLISSAVFGCTRKATPTPIEELKLIKDDVRKFEIKVPANWYIQTVSGELVLATSHKGVSRRFFDFSRGEGGAKVEFRAIQLDSTRSMDSLIKNSKLEFEDHLDRYTVTDVSVGGKKGKLLAVHFDQEDGEYRSEAYFAENDSVVSILTLAAFGKTFEDYKEPFDEIVKSVKLARRPDVISNIPDTIAPTGPEPPSDTLRPYSSSEFTIQIPQNFEGKNANTAGLSAINFVGSRLDCNIQIDVFDATKQNKLDKIIEQNKPNYGGGDARSTSLGGTKAYYFSYTPTKTVSSRAYFVIKDKKLFRITVNWYKAQEKLYLPIFEKSLATVTFK